jgi:hypothetical protein
MGDRVLSAGEWLGVADRAEALLAELRGTRLEHWEGSLRFLVADCQREAGARCVHEVRQDDDEQRRAA